MNTKFTNQQDRHITIIERTTPALLQEAIDYFLHNQEGKTGKCAVTFQYQTHAVNLDGQLIESFSVLVDQWTIQ